MIDDLVVPSISKEITNILPKRFKRGEVLLPIDQPVVNLWYLVSGYVRQYSISLQGEEFTLNILRPGSIFPLTLALSNQENRYYFQALSSVVVKPVMLSFLLEQFQAHSTVAISLMKKLSLGLNQLSSRTESIIFGTAQEKIVAVLLLLADRFGHNSQNKSNSVSASLSQKPSFAAPIIIDAFKISHQLLASMTALTRETVTVEMRRLKKQALLDYRSSHITLLKPQKLLQISSLPT